MSSDLPNEASITQLIGAVLLEQNEECLLRWRYMQIEGMDQLTPLLLDAEPAKRRLTDATSSSTATYLILTDITESLDTFASPTLSEQERVLSIEPHGRCENHLVTVVICVYNAGEYLRPSLLSILGQTHRNLDILIVDDGSTDGCLATVEDLLADRRVRVFRQANGTKPVALNRALDLARGEFYAIHDADDISYPKRIQRQLDALLTQPHLAAVYCGNDLIINGRSLAPVFAPMNEGECKRAIDTFGLPAADPTGMYRMSLVNHLRYDTSFPIGQGLDYILRVGEQHPMVVLGECLYGYRVLPRSNTRGDPTLRERLIANVLKQACDRRGLDYGHLYPHRTGHKWRSRASVRDNNLAAHFIKSVLDQLRAGCRLDAIRTGIACAHLQPFDPHYYKALVYALSSPDIVKFVRRKALAK